MTKIAVLGLGIMGHGVADNFLKNGQDVAVWNRSSEKYRDLVARGARQANSVVDALQDAELVFEITANDESSRTIWLGENGIIANANQGQILITCATLSVEWVDELAKICAEKGLTFFDMPMTGGRVAAENGQLTLLVGGNEAGLDEVKPHLKNIASQVKYFGSAGSGMRYKLVLNSLQAVHIAAFGEAMQLARTLGLDERLVGEALVERPGGALTQLAWKGYNNLPDPINFSVGWIAKDQAYALKNVPYNSLPILTESLLYYERAVSAGLANKDWTYIVKSRIN